MKRNHGFSSPSYSNHRHALLMLRLARV